MRAKLVHESHGQRTFVVVLDTDDEVMASLMRFAEQETVSAAQVTAIGAFRAAVLGFFDWERKDYERIPVDEQVEVVSLLGDIGVEESGKPALHLHALLSRRDGSTVGGHLLEAQVRPTLEVVVTESPAHLRRRKDQETGLTLIRF
jgi:predicted DNA-binding protein with PD1-like motif